MSAGPSSRQRLSRGQRLRTQADFRQLKQNGVRLTQGCMAVNWRERPAKSASRLGVITSRHMGSAVLRSRARRLLREAFRRHQAELRQPLDMVLVARNSIVGKKLAGVEKDLLAAWRRGGLLKTAA